MNDVRIIYNFFLNCVETNIECGIDLNLEYFYRTNEYHEYKELYNKTINRRNKIKRINERYR